MSKRIILFYLFIGVFFIATLIFEFSYGLIIWYLINLIGNSIIIQRILNIKNRNNKVIVISSILLLVPIIYILGLVFLLGGITC